jgi:PITH domain
MSHSHCGDESHNHDHSHSHSPPPDSIPGDSLYTKIDIDRVRCLNERAEGMARAVIKPWDQRLDTEKVQRYGTLLTNLGT